MTVPAGRSESPNAHLAAAVAVDDVEVAAWLSAQAPGHLLTDVSRGTVVLDDVISTTFRADLSDAYVGVKRVAMGMGGAVRSNIARLIERFAAMGEPVTVSVGDQLRMNAKLPNTVTFAKPT